MVISRFALSLIGPAQVCVVVKASIWEYIEAELLLLSVLSYSTLLLSVVVWSASIHLNIFDMSLVGKVAGRVVVVVKVRETYLGRLLSVGL